MSQTPAERWMLPDGIEEILPPEAAAIEALRRKLLDLMARWGFELVAPPALEFVDSLLVGLGEDIDLLTFRVVDQHSGRSMGIPADMTPQIARIDAHSLRRQGVNRLCYAGRVLRTHMQNALDTRSPLQVGVELFGEAGLGADLEIASLLLDVLDAAGVRGACMELGHVAIFRALVGAAGLNDAQEAELFELLQAKALTDIHQWVQAQGLSEPAVRWFTSLPRLSGGARVMAQARVALAGAPAEVFEALTELERLGACLSERYSDAQLYFDLSELFGYHYSTGAIFTVFAPGRGSAIARGGRYDHIGEVFGRARPATGFTADLVALERLGSAPPASRGGVFAPASEDPQQFREIQALRHRGERVVSGASGQAEPHPYQSCDRVLVADGGHYRVQPL